MVASNFFTKIIFPCEFLTAKDLLIHQVPDLLAQTDTYVALKISEEDLETDDLKTLVLQLRERDIEDHLVPWPLLSIDDGYYPNEQTIGKFHHLIHTLLEWYKTNEFLIPEGILVDLEPSVDPKTAKKAIKVREKQLAQQNKKEKKKRKKKKKGKVAKNLGLIKKLVEFIEMMKKNIDPVRFNASISDFNKLQEMMHEYGSSAIAVALPLAYEDQTDGQLLLQDFFTVPITHPDLDWDTINFMIFNTDYVSASKKIISHEDYRHLIYLYGKEFVKRYGKEKASITLGITNLGVQDVRAVQTDPDLYRLEASALLASGMTNLGIYALDGILEQKNPRKWIETVKQARAEDFVIDPEKLEFAGMVRRLFQTVDFISPVLNHLVQSGRYKKIFRLAFLGKL
jgi:RNase H-fold protein (predicted Holliday junction resolvase)